MSQRAQAAINSPWWPEFLAIKDGHSFEELARRFGTNVYTLRTALGLAGVSKTLLPPGPRRPDSVAAAASSRGLPVVVVAAIAPYASLLGTVPDSAVAAMALVTDAEVAAFRVMNGIAPFDEPAPPAPPAPVKRPVGRPRLHPRPDGVPVRPAKPAAPKAAPAKAADKPAKPAKPAKAAAVKAAAAPAKAAAVKAAAAPAKPAAVKAEAASKPAPAVTPVATGFRPSRLDAYAHLVGSVPDSEVAALVKMSVEGVRLYRKARNIPSSFEAKVGGAARAAPVSQPAAVAAPVQDVAPKAEGKAAFVKAISAPPVAVAKSEAAEVPAVAAAAPAVVVPAVAGVAASHRAFSVVAVRGDEQRKFAVVGASILDALDIAVRALSARQDGPWRVGSIREGIEALTLPG